MDLNDFDEYGWKKSNKPWKSMQERFCPDYNVRVGQKKHTNGKVKESPSLFDVARRSSTNCSNSEKLHCRK